MNIKASVAELLKDNPRSLGVLERFRIDFCCGGADSLEEACQRAKVSLDEVVLALNATAGESDSEAETLAELPRELEALVGYVVEKHHVYTREALERVLPLAEKVARVHGANHPDYVHLHELVMALADDLGPHMLKEERVLFPYLCRLSNAASSGPPSRPPFGSASNPIGVMHAEHDQVAEILVAMEASTKGFSVPSDACGSTQALFLGLHALDRDLRRHIYIENQLMFPLAIALEAQPA